jgi:hypothetical protein
MRLEYFIHREPFTFPIQETSHFGPRLSVPVTIILIKEATDRRFETRADAARHSGDTSNVICVKGQQVGYVEVVTHLSAVLSTKGYYGR